MATEDKLCLPEHLDDGDARSWFKRYELCAAANEWNEAKRLLRLPTLFKGSAWAIFESLGDDVKDTYDHLKGAMMEKLNPDTDENHMHGGMGTDLERMLDKSSPGFPAEIRETKL